MNARKEGKTQAVSAAKAGISERRGRDIEKGQRIDPSAQQRAWINAWVHLKPSGQV